ncbi:MAG: hypothetical protein QGG55_04250, partial [Verrucomicrobiota bacterium]|nr:hypothetical protein [Verrucomicrobiota bacterium]
MKIYTLFTLTMSLCLPLAGLAAAPPKVKPVPRPGIRPAPRPLPGRGPGRFPGQNAKPQPVKWNEKQVVVSGTITDIKQGPTARSFPPIYNNTLTLKIDGVLRGGLKIGAQFQAHHSARQMEKPKYPQGRVVVALSNVRGGFRIEGLEAADPKKLAAIKLACELPMGWVQAKGKLTSPWAAQKGGAWPKEQKVEAKHFCSVTGRYIEDFRTGERRQATRQDAIEGTLMADALENVHGLYKPVMWLFDEPKICNSQLLVGEWMKNTNKTG